MNELSKETQFKKSVQKDGINLTPFQIEEKTVEAVTMENNIEVAELRYKHFKKNIDDGIPLLDAKVELQRLENQIALTKGNLKVLKRQIETEKLK